MFFFSFKFSFKSTGKISQLNNRQVINYMELASNTAQYFFNNSICCFGCREFCIDQHLAIQLPLNTDWLTRRCQNRPHRHHQHQNTSKQHQYTHAENQFYSYYHRHKRRTTLPNRHHNYLHNLTLFVAADSILPGYRQKIRKK